MTVQTSHQCTIGAFKSLGISPLFLTPSHVFDCYLAITSLRSLSSVILPVSMQSTDCIRVVYISHVKAFSMSLTTP